MQRRDNAQQLFSLDAFEMWIYCRVSKISWTENITNEEVLRRMGTGREVVRQFKTRKLRYLGDLIRHIHMTTTTNRRKDRRQKISWPTKNYLDNGPEAKYYELKRAAEDRKRWHGLVVNFALKRQHFGMVRMLHSQPRELVFESSLKLLLFRSPAIFSTMSQFTQPHKLVFIRFQ